MKVALRKPRLELADKIERDCKAIYKSQSSDYVRLMKFLRGLRGNPVVFNEMRNTHKILPRGYDWNDELDRLMLLLGEPAQEFPYPWSIEAAVSNPIVFDTRLIVTNTNAALRAAKAQLAEVVEAAKRVPRTKQDDWYREALSIAERTLEEINCLGNLTDLTEIH